MFANVTWMAALVTSAGLLGSASLAHAEARNQESDLLRELSKSDGNVAPPDTGRADREGEAAGTRGMEPGRLPNRLAFELSKTDGSNPDFEDFLAEGSQQPQFQLFGRTAPDKAISEELRDELAKTDGHEAPREEFPA